jgi:hypothetical protein
MTAVSAQSAISHAIVKGSMLRFTDMGKVPDKVSSITSTFILVRLHEIHALLNIGLVTEKPVLDQCNVTFGIGGVILVFGALGQTLFHLLVPDLQGCYVLGIFLCQCCGRFDPITDFDGIPAKQGKGARRKDNGHVKPVAIPVPAFIPVPVHI